jgi:hypothetical protein
MTVTLVGAIGWSIALPVLVAILFFGAFTTVYILMRRPSFGERGIPSEPEGTPTQTVTRRSKVRDRG